MSPSPVALVPVNRLDRAKGRLSELLAPAERSELARLTLLTVLQAIDEAGLRTAVLTADEAVVALLPHGVMHIPEATHLQGLNPQLEFALEELNAPAVLVLHADLPLASAASVQHLLAAAPPARSATLVASADGGTNAMLLRPPRGFPLAYGPGSAAAHRHNARQAGYALADVHSPELTLDLDTPADLQRLREAHGGRGTPAGRYLVDLGIGTGDRRTGRE